MQEVLFHLGKLGYHDVWVEAGGTFFSALHLAGLVNRTYLYLVPSLLGSAASDVYQDALMFGRAHTVTWQAMGDNMMAIFEWQGD